jgi:hypothetical protein
MYRINELLKLDRQIYHTNDLAILWRISNKNTLYTTIKRYVQKRILIQIYKGLYSTVDPDKLDVLNLGKAVIHRYTYLSTESVLVQSGVIIQTVYNYTFIADLAKRITVGSRTFVYRKLKDKYLHNLAGIESRRGNYIATPERAVADLLYFNPKYNFDFRKNIDCPKVKQIQKEVGYD